MSIRKTCLSVAIGLLLQMAGTTHAGLDKGIPFDSELTPTQMPLKPGPVELSFSYSPAQHCRDCSTVVMTVTTQGGLEYSGPTTWTVAVEQGVKYTEVINVSIPPNDTCGIRILMSPNGVGGTGAVAWFVTFDDTVEFWKGCPVGATPRNKMTYAESRSAELTPEELVQVLDWEVNLKGVLSRQLEFVLPMLGELTPTEKDSVFQIRISRGTYWKLRDMGINPEWLKPPPADSSLLDTTPDSLKSQGALDPKGSGAFTLERTEGALTDTTLPTGQSITFYLRIDNSTNNNVDGMMNGFRVYSPDGATWNSTVGDTLGTLDSVRGVTSSCATLPRVGGGLSPTATS